MSYVNVEKISFFGNSFVSKRKTISGSEMNSSSSTKNCILQSLNHPLFLIKDFNSLVKNISKKQQKHYYSFYNEFCQEQIEQLRETLQDEKFS
jgi:ferritin